MKKAEFIKVFAALLGVVVVCLLLCLPYWLGIRVLLQDNSLSKEEIFDVVNSKYEIIMNDIQKGEFQETKKIKGIVRVEVSGNVIEFSCEGKGNAVSGAYYGFYYTDDNLPKVSFLYVLFTERDLVPKDNGYCFDEYDYYYTEKIRDKFYYYELYY